MESLLAVQNQALKSQMTTTATTSSSTAATVTDGSGDVTSVVALDSITKMVDELIQILETITNMRSVVID